MWAEPDGVAARVDRRSRNYCVIGGRLDLERYKATIKGLTQFGDRLQEPIATVRPAIGSKLSSRVTAAPTSNA